jgi:hypothetical protein
VSDTVAAFQRAAVGAQLLNDSRAAKHRREHDGSHPHTVVGVDVGAVLEEQVQNSGDHRVMELRAEKRC